MDNFKNRLTPQMMPQAVAVVNEVVRTSFVGFDLWLSVSDAGLAALQ